MFLLIVADCFLRVSRAAYHQKGKEPTTAGWTGERLCPVSNLMPKKLTQIFQPSNFPLFSLLLFLMKEVNIFNQGHKQYYEHICQQVHQGIGNR